MWPPRELIMRTAVTLLKAIHPVVGPYVPLPPPALPSATTPLARPTSSSFMPRRCRADFSSDGFLWRSKSVIVSHGDQSSPARPKIFRYRRPAMNFPYSAADMNHELAPTRSSSALSERSGIDSDGRRKL